MIKIIKEIGEWIKSLTTSFSGVFVLGVLFAGFPIGLSLYTQHQSYERLLQENLELVKEKNSWEQRAYNSEAECMSKMKEMLMFFKELEDTFGKERKRSDSILNRESKVLKQYERISKRLSK